MDWISVVLLAAISCVLQSCVTGQTDCMDPLGMKSGAIPNSAITASSTKNNRPPWNARLDNKASWASLSSDSDPWIEVDLQAQRVVRGLITQGKGKKDFTTSKYSYWATKYRVQSGTKETSLTYITDDNGEPKEFEGNTGELPKGHVTIVFPSPIVAQFIRIEPKNCYRNGEEFDTCVLRFEVLGCDIDS